MRTAVLWCAIAFAAVAGVAPVARAQEQGGDQSWLDDPVAADVGDVGPLHDGWMAPGRGGMGRGDFMGRGRGMGRGVGRMGGMGPGFGGRGWARDLDLTDAQREKLADLREQRLKRAIPVQADLRLAELDLRRLLRTDKPDMPAVERQIDKVSDLRATLMKIRVAGLLEARSVLTPAQQKKLREPASRTPAGPPARRP